MPNPKELNAALGDFCNRLESLSDVPGIGLRYLTLSGSQALSLCRRLQDRFEHTGYWPVLVGSKSEFDDWLEWLPVYLAETFEEVPVGERYKKWLALETDAGKHLQFEEWTRPEQQAERYLSKRDELIRVVGDNPTMTQHYERLAAESLEPFVIADHPRPDKPAPSLSNFEGTLLDYRESQLSPPGEGLESNGSEREMCDATVALVPCQCVSEVPIRLMFGETYELRPAVHSAMILWAVKSLDAKLVTLNPQRLTIELEVPKQTLSWERWLTMARQICAYAAIVNDDFFSIPEAASSMENSTVLRLQWTF